MPPRRRRGVRPRPLTPFPSRLIQRRQTLRLRLGEDAACARPEMLQRPVATPPKSDASANNPRPSAPQPWIFAGKAQIPGQPAMIPGRDRPARAHPDAKSMPDAPNSRVSRETSRLVGNRKEAPGSGNAPAPQPFPRRQPDNDSPSESPRPGRAHEAVFHVKHAASTRGCEWRPLRVPRPRGN